MRRTATLHSALGLVLVASFALAQDGPRQPPGNSLEGDIFGLEDSEWRLLLTPADQQIASGYIGREVFVDALNAGAREFGVLRYKLAPHIFDNGHFIDGVMLMTPPDHFIEVFECDRIPVRMGRIEGCFEPDLMSIRATLYLEPVVDPAVCEPMRTPPGTTFPEGGSRLGLARATPLGRVATAASNPLPSLDLQGLADFYADEAAPTLRQLEFQDATTLRDLNFRLRQAKERLRTFPVPADPDLRELKDYIAERVDTALAVLSEQPELAELPPALSPGAKPRNCLLDPPEACDRSQSPDELRPLIQRLRTALSEASEQHVDLPTEFFYQDDSTDVATLAVLNEQIHYRGPDAWLHGVAAQSDPGHGLLAGRLQRLAFFDWCDDEAFLDTEARLNRLRAETIDHYDRTRRLYSQAAQQKARMQRDIERYFDTWTEWSVFESVFGTNSTPTGPLQLVLAVSDIIRVNMGLEESDPASRVAAQALDWYIDAALGILEMPAPSGVQPKPSWGQRGNLWFQNLKAATDITFAIRDLINLSNVGGLVGEDDADDLLPQFLRYSEQTAYLDHLLAHDQELMEVLEELAAIFIAERARRF